MTKQSRPLTEKEQKTVQAFESKRPGLGEIAKQGILNKATPTEEIT